jgi:hypothetical protein
MLSPRLKGCGVAIALAAAATACSDSSDNRPGGGGPTEPPPISIETPNADRCEILDSDNCMFPWPSTVFTVADESTDTGRRINLAMESMPENKAGVVVDPTEWNRNDGFSPSQSIVTQVPGLDLEATGVPALSDLEQSLGIDAPVLVIRARTGEPHLIFGELDVQAEDLADQTFIIRPMAQFERGERYIVALRNLKDGEGNVIEAPEVFRAYRDDTLTDNDAIEERRPAMEDIFATLEEAGVAREDLYLAWDFNVASVRNITERVLHIRDEAFAELANAAPAFTVTEVVDFAPCDESGCQEGQSDEISREISGTFEVPKYLDSDDGGPGSAFFYDTPDDGLPDRMGGDNLLDAVLLCRVPRSVAENFEQEPVAVARPYFFGHGLLGDVSEIREPQNNAMMNEHQMMLCATNWIGFSSKDTAAAAQALGEWSQMAVLIDQQVQSYLNAMYLARLLKHPEGLASDPAFHAGGQPVFDTSTVYFDSDSLGAVMGGGLMGVIQDVTRGVLGVPGMSYSMLLRRSKNWATYGIFMTGAAGAGGYPDPKDQAFLLSMIQMLWDRSESSGYAYHISENLLPNTPSHEVLLHVAYGDHSVSMWAADMLARTLGAGLRVPTLEEGRHPDENPFVGLEPIPAGDYTGNAMVVWDNGPIGGGAENGGTAPPPITNIPPTEPDYGTNSHWVPRREPAARQQKSDFLMPDGEGRFVDPCDPSLPCTADGYLPGGS